MLGASEWLNSTVPCFFLFLFIFSNCAKSNKKPNGNRRLLGRKKKAPAGKSVTNKEPPPKVEQTVRLSIHGSVDDEKKDTVTVGDDLQTAVHRSQHSSKSSKKLKQKPNVEANKKENQKTSENVTGFEKPQEAPREDSVKAEGSQQHSILNDSNRPTTRTKESQKEKKESTKGGKTEKENEKKKGTMRKKNSQTKLGTIRKKNSKTEKTTEATLETQNTKDGSVVLQPTQRTEVDKQDKPMMSSSCDSAAETNDNKKKEMGKVQNQKNENQKGQKKTENKKTSESGSAENPKGDKMEPASEDKLKESDVGEEQMQVSATQPSITLPPESEK